MLQRSISTVSLWLTLIAVIYFFDTTGIVFLLIAFSGVAQKELYRMLMRMGYLSNSIIGIASGTLLLLVAHFSGANAPVVDVLVITFIVLCTTVIFVDEKERNNRLKKFMPTLFGILFVPFTLHYYVKAYQLPEIIELDLALSGIAIICWITVVSKFSDVGALLIGRKIGKNKLAPSLSPGKTKEGAIGGILVSCVLGVILAKVLFPPEFFPMWKALIMSFILAIFSIIGDLIESVFKRKSGVKDSGNIIPGIGGIFDLLDSLILAAPVGYLLFRSLLF